MNDSLKTRKAHLSAAYSTMIKNKKSKKSNSSSNKGNKYSSALGSVAKVTNANKMMGY